MEYLFAVALVAGLGLVRALSLRLSWLGSVAERVPRLRPADDGERPAEAVRGSGEAGQLSVEWEPLTQSFIRRRLDALVEELERLDRNPDVFAKAFHTMVARSAHEALLADASRLAAQPSRYASHTFEVEVVGTPTGPREELEL